MLIHLIVSAGVNQMEYDKFVFSFWQNVRFDCLAGEGFEPQIVTEIPKALFKRPKFKNYSAKVNTTIDEGEQILDQNVDTVDTCLWFILLSFYFCLIDSLIWFTGDNFKPKIVTEMPKAVFKKPKLKNYSVAVNTNADQGK